MKKNKENKKKTGLRVAIATAIIAVFVVGCSAQPAVSQPAPAQSAGEAGEGAHSESGSESGGEGGDANEGGGATALMPNEIYDVTNNGARLILAFDAPSNTFVGTVENTTSSALTRARVEIHLSNGTELGPTTPTDLVPGEIIQINLPATSQAFDTWSPHALSYWLYFIVFPCTII